MQKELAEARATIRDHSQTIQDVSRPAMGQSDVQLNREVSELESLIESKIYREDELETRLAQLQDEVKRYKALSTNGNGPHTPPARSETSGHSRAPSIANSTATEDRCELCEGPHDLDACPVFAGNMGGDEDRPSPLAGKEVKKGKWCADCEVSGAVSCKGVEADEMQSDAHDTADCPMAEDVF